MSDEKETDIQSGEESDSEYEDYDDYYNNNDDNLSSDEEPNDNYSGQKGQGDNRDNNNVKKLIQDLEYFEYECLATEQVDEKLEQECASVASKLKVKASVAGLVLQANKWKTPVILQKATIGEDERIKLLINAGVQCASAPPSLPVPVRKLATTKIECGVCFDLLPRQKLAWLSCMHAFCRDCWHMHIETVVKDGMPVGVECMAKGCSLFCPKDFVEQFLNMQSRLAMQYKIRFRDACVTAHYLLRFCAGADCSMVIYSKTPKARHVKCKECLTEFCFECGNNYHSPTDCDTIKRWLLKCGDDSETAHYICANTKNCPRCNICIEKNGGCNHIQCSKCKFNFCWMCLGDWSSHGNSYYVCSKYKENPLIAEQNQKSQAREALKKYLFYFERWENHSQSLHLEAEARKRIQEQIEKKVMNNEGTWIDWQYLLRAGELLAKCRLTLQNTYPLAYYSPVGAEKELFEYQQAQLEVEIEELSWKLENAGSYQRGDIENQMDVAGKRRHTLLLHFLKD
ncbi:E3 ubiquitin-protein ligase ARIH2-like [Styela clava]